MIKSYGRRLIRKRIDREQKKRVETRDAIIWEIIPSQKICRIKIQGSDTLLQARYPENIKQKPDWLKVGSAVRVQHIGGNRNRIEVVGCGLNVPTPVPGAAAEPTMATGGNVVLTGCQVYALTGMDVWISPGTYRINDVIYTLESGIVMSATSPVIMSETSTVLMGEAAGVFTVSTASTTMYRMDAFFIGADGVIDYVVGTPSATNPQVPDTPAAHVLLGWVMVPPNATSVSQDLINYAFVEPFVAQMTANASPDELPWLTSSTPITVKILDQYGNGITGTNWRVTATIQSGTGTLSSASLSTGDSSSQVVFTYNRVAGYDNEIDPVAESCPVWIEFVLSQNSGITMLIPIILLDELGGAVFG